MLDDSSNIILFKNERVSLKVRQDFISSCPTKPIIRPSETKDTLKNRPKAQ
jgi:hypothetical protein